MDEEIKKAKALLAKGTPRNKIYAELTKNGATKATAARRAPPNQAETLVEGMKNPRGAEAALNLNAVGGQSRAKSFDHHLGGIALQALLNDPARERFVIGQAAFGFADESCHDPQKEYVVRPAIVTLTASNLASKIALQCPINAAFT